MADEGRPQLGHQLAFYRTNEDESLWAAKCECSWLSDIYLTKVEARTAHGAHQIAPYFVMAGLTKRAAADG